MNPEAKRPGQCWSRTGLRSRVPGQKHRSITDQSPGPAPSWPEPRFTHLKRKHEAFRGLRHCRALRERPSPMCVLVCPRWLRYADGRKTPLGRGSGKMKGGARDAAASRGRPSASCPTGPAAVGAPSPTLPGMAEGEGLAGRHCRGSVSLGRGPRGLVWGPTTREPRAAWAC